MTRQRITVDRIDLTLDGWGGAQAELLAGQLQAALAAQAWAGETAGDPAGAAAAGHGTADLGAFPDPATMETPLAGPALAQAVAARLMTLISQAAEVHPPQEVPPWP